MNKIILRFQLPLICGIVFSTGPLLSPAQDSAFNKYGLLVISNAGQLQTSYRKDPSREMTDLKKCIPGIQLELRYAGRNNFMHQQLYPFITTTYLRKQAADSLALVQKELNQIGLGLKIFDAYRPYSVTEKMWEPVKDDRYAADPKKGSGHNRGAAVDLTILNVRSNKELDMGTGFDNFSDTAHHAFSGLPVGILQNRSLLKTMMEKHGFKALDTEWWHYSLYNAAGFELLDVNFAILKKLNSTPLINKKNNHVKRKSSGVL